MDPIGSKTVPIVCGKLNQISSRGIWFSENHNPLLYSVPNLLCQIFLITIITHFVHFCLKPFGQPIIVSQILGGVLLGPSVMGKNSAFSNNIFPARSRVVLDTLAMFGFMFFIFIMGVKVDPMMVLKSGKKSLVIGILSFFVPYMFTRLFAFFLNKWLSLDKDISLVLPLLVDMLSMTAFPVISCFLEDFKILNSEIGRLASSTSFICDVSHWFIIALRCLMNLSITTSLQLSFASFTSGALFFFFVVFGIRPMALWAIRRTPEERPVKEKYILMAMVAVLGCGFIGEVIGISATIASLAIGLMIPDGPPLGSAFVERLDCIVSVLLMPLYFAMCGQHLDIFSIHEFKNVGVLQSVVLMAFFWKSIAVIVPLVFARVPVRDAVSLGLIMNSKGIIELAFMNQYRNSGIMSDECYAIMLISIVALTAIISPIIKVIYDPSKRYLAYKRRTILHSRNDEELRILACLHNPDNVRAILRLIKLSNPSKDSPINLVVLHLVKLTGRASSILVSYHERDKPSANPTQSERIFGAFRKVEHQSNGLLTLDCFKGASPYATMHDDVCYLALEKRTILIILPFHKQWTYGERVETSTSLRRLNKNVLEKSPCSVGILVSRVSHHRSSRYATANQSLPLQRVAVTFLGGPDDREALSYGQRMAENSSVFLTVIQFTMSNGNEIVGGKHRSKMLDADIIRDFKRKTMVDFSERVTYREEPVDDGIGMESVVKTVAEGNDLVIVGRRHGESEIMFQLSKWEEKGELGVVGEILATGDSEEGANVLVLQQQTRLWGLQDPEESTHLRRVDL